VSSNGRLRTAYGSEVQTVPGTLRGYRAWRIERDWRFLGLHNTGLTALSHRGFVWSSGEPVQAQCSPFLHCFCGEGEGCFSCAKTKHHDAPVANCSCGYYATYDPEHYKENTGLGHYYIHGCIKAYGRVSLGSRGFRAQYAEVEAVWGRFARAAARRYGVPWFRSQERMLEHFPKQDVTELLR
jgi:hypothetical protein